MPTLDWLDRQAAFSSANKTATHVLRPHAAGHVFLVMPPLRGTTGSFRATTCKSSKSCCSFTTARTAITADTYQQARLMLTRIYGEGNVFNVTQTMAEGAVTEATKTLSPKNFK